MWLRSGQTMKWSCLGFGLSLLKLVAATAECLFHFSFSRVARMVSVTRSIVRFVHVAE